MPETASDARRLMDAKLSIPSELRSAEWRMVPQWTRERAFYMAGVAQAEILDRFRSEAASIVQGETSIPQAERRLAEYLAAANYRPGAGQEGTIKDLRTWRRMRVALRTNVQLLQGWGQKQRGLGRGAAMAFPAWELVRYEPAQVPRDWGSRWQLSGGGLVEGGRMIALKDSDVWAELGNFEDGLGVDYPPFAWGSGMGWKAVSRREAKRLGILPEGWEPPARQPVESPNATLQSKPRIRSRELRGELARAMGGLAEWQGDTLVFTDPNGTRPAGAGKLIEVWERGMPEVFEALRGEGLMQRDSLLRWLGDHEQFREANDTDGWDDLLRLQQRLTSRPVERLWRGLAMSREKLDAFLRAIRGGYRTRAEYPLESWTASQAAAATYARSGGRGWSVILEVRGPRRAADFSAFARAYAGRVAKQPSPPLATESEWVYATGRAFRVVDTIKDSATRTVQLILEELP